MPSLHDLLIIQVAATGMMTGLIWFVQLVHYPLMARVGTDEWITYENEHTRRTSWIVAPTMLIELVSTILILTESRHHDDQWITILAITGMILVALLWATTFFVQVPLHRHLSRQHDEHAIRKLVTTNWIRTALWTTHLITTAIMLTQME